MDFKEQLVEAFKNSLLLAVKYSVIVVVIIYVFNYTMQTRQLAMNGNEAATAILEYQKAGVLPKFPLEKK